VKVGTNVLVALGLLGTALAPAAAQCSRPVHDSALTRVDFQPEKNIVEVASEAGSFSTLIAAARAAGLAEALSSQGPLTVFAPTDEAFAELGTETINELLRPENKQRLADILKYHVISGRVYSDQALDAGTAETLQGESVDFTLRSGTARVDGAGIVATDIEASNGVIHVIDRVIMPHGM